MHDLDPAGASLRWRSTLMGTVAGSAAIAMYLGRTFLPLPDAVSVYCYMLFGPALVLAFLGWLPLMQLSGAELTARVATVFGIVAGAVNMMFAVVQMNNLDRIGAKIAGAATPERADEWRRILSGVFTVQNGLNFTMDFFLDAAAFCYAAIMWRHPGFGKAVALLSIALVGPHFVMKLFYFPTPPAEAGGFDGGPLVGVWFTVATVFSIRWLLKNRTAA